MLWNCGRFTFDLSTPAIMGILNVTPDSFSDGGEHLDHNDAYQHAMAMIEQGATIIDVGGESTRPGSNEVPDAEELARVLPVVRRLADEGVAVSIDTRHFAVAKACVEAGAAIVNDVSGFRDIAMRELAASTDVGCVVMHMLGEPKSMQDDPHYDDVVSDVSDYLLAQAELLITAGVSKDRICIDPGPGFGKNFEHNLALLHATPELSSLGFPLMAAFSRKRTVGQMAGLRAAAANPSERALASAIVAAWTALHGATVLRVHDVRETVEALSVLNCLQKPVRA